MPSITLDLTPQGPMVRVAVMVSTPRRKALEAAGLPIPPPVLVSLLVDTGAFCTCVDSAHLGQLQISPSGIIEIYTPSTGATPVKRKQYDVDVALILDNGNHLFIDTLPVVESTFAANGIDGLLGRDVLSGGILIYNGTTDSITVAF
jgi:hypothetical protein